MKRSLSYYGVSVAARLKTLFKSWRCRDKILVFESDDWGSIRTSTREAYQSLIEKGYEMERSFWQLDALETDDDLSALYEVLTNYKDLRGRPVCFTGNVVMANPDFESIRRSGFQEYYIENVSKTLSSFSNRQGVTKLWQEGMESMIFRPQLHAREHIRWWEWIAALNSGSEEARITFDMNMCGLEADVSKEGRSFFVPPYVSEESTKIERVDLAAVIRESFKLFEKQFGFKSLSTIAPFCAWTDQVEKIWSELGVRYIQGGYCQIFNNNENNKFIPHYLGEKSKYHCIYLIKNCNFEPASSSKGYSLKKTLAQINKSFMLGLPAIVSTHRVNYIGSINEENRKENLRQLVNLLSQIKSKWPDVHFLSSVELGYMIENDLRHVVDLENLEDKLYPVLSI